MGCNPNLEHSIVFNENSITEQYHRFFRIVEAATWCKRVLSAMSYLCRQLFGSCYTLVVGQLSGLFCQKTLS